jgi:pyruvate-formate lyase-activating enzyme
MKSGIYSFCTGMVDFPNRYALTIYFNGCNLDCDFCHNKHLLNCESNYSLDDVVKAYYSCKEIIPSTGVVFSGGEPTYNDVFYEVLNVFEKEPTSLHTNGLIDIPEYNGNIILGLKPFTNKEYITQINKYLKTHSHAKYKEIRYVKGIGRKGYNEVLAQISSSAKEYCWNVVGVNDSRKP